MKKASLRSCLAVTAVLGVLVAGCGQVSSTNSAVTPAPPVAAFGASPTEQDCYEFGQQLEAAVVSGDREAVIRLYRLDDLVERCMSDLSLSAASRRGFLEAFASRSGALADVLIDTVQKGGTFKPLRIRTVEGRRHILMRILDADGMLNYQEVTLARFPNGQIAAEDVHVMATGEMISQTLRRGLLRTVAEEDQGLLGKVNRKERVFTTHAPRIQSMVRSVIEGRHQEALTIYHQLPAELQKEKVVLLAAMRAAQGVSEQEYFRVLETFRQNHPDDPSLDLILIDYYTLKKEYDESLQCIAKLDKSVGGDPYLLVMRGNILLEAGRIADAKAEVEKAIEQDPKLEIAYWSRMTMALGEENHSDTFAWLKKIIEQCGVELDAEYLKTVEAYAAFVKSPEFQVFQEWSRGRRK